MVVAATIKRMDDVCTHPVSGSCCTPVGAVIIFVGVGVDFAIVGLAIPPVLSFIGMRVGVNVVLL